ncbi:CDP-alcohol phosphatidyltransferase family protein [Millisia brevis]|uniref:CDP-alcohol phosphatidyltransferase family protein n=1 Tax=Millisia brevis TaxID=264148 RepID=UPI001FDEDB09|nr:CDP-alcohol phosphatidyltransferase family protein [Millisia brevis]
MLSAIRLLGVPLFAYLLLVVHADGWALIVLVVGGATDWLDGKLARLLDQYSTLGAILDPLIDRIYLVSVLLCFAARELLPWWLVVLLLAREALLAISLGAYRRRGLAPPEVIYIGKAATFALMAALPMLLFATLDPVVRNMPEFGGIGLVEAVALALVWWGTALYLWSGGLYLWQAIRVARGAPVP